MQEEVIGRAMTDERKRLEQAVIDGIPEEQRILLDNLLTSEESLYQLTLLKFGIIKITLLHIWH